tara:strand:- start:114 stop:452 length:339 start_codon:yes stop_codon:yes gene_type:complete
MSGILTKVNVIIAIIIAVPGIWAAGASIGLDIPRWAWISEVHAAENKLNGIELRSERLYLDILRRNKTNTLSKMAELEAKGIQIPLIMKNQLEELQTDISDQKQYIIQLRKK